ncbi:MAG: hypothetical protein RIE59_11920, partial [Imperialibacter sp.]
AAFERASYGKMEDVLKVRWIGLIETLDGSTDLPQGRPLLRNGVVIPGAASTHGFDLQTGQKIYYETDGDEVFRRVGDSLLYLSTRHNTQIINIKAGRLVQRYSQDTPMPFVQAPMLANEGLLPVINKNTLELFDVITGQKMLTHKSPSPILGNVLITNDYVFFGDREAVYFANADSVEKLDVGRLSSIPFKIGSFIYAFIRQKGVIAIDDLQNDVKWSAVRNSFAASFDASGKNLLVNDGALALINGNTGVKLMEPVLDETLSEEHLVNCGDIIITYIDSFEAIPIICALNARTGQLENAYWNDPSMFEVKGLHRRGSAHPEADGGNTFGPVFAFSNAVDGMVIGQFENMIVGFEIIAK